MNHMAWMLALVLAGIGVAQASEADAPALPDVEIPMDAATLKKGLMVFTSNCQTCHGLRYLQYRHLREYREVLGLTDAEIQELQGDHDKMETFKPMTPPEAAKEMFGLAPPDLSLITRARKGGARYVYALLTGYAHDPKGKVPDGNYNLYFPGHRIAMPDPLGWLDHDPAQTKELEEQARAVAAFLAFVGDPHQLERRAIGKWVLGFLVLLTIVFYLLYRETWKDIHNEGGKA